MERPLKLDSMLSGSIETDITLILQNHFAGTEAIIW